MSVPQVVGFGGHTRISKTILYRVLLIPFLTRTPPPLSLCQPLPLTITFTPNQRNTHVLLLRYAGIKQATEKLNGFKAYVLRYTPCVLSFIEAGRG